MAGERTLDGIAGRILDGLGGPSYVPRLHCELVNMRFRICGSVAAVHLILLASSTYLAAISIESILVTGGFCAFSGFAAGLAALFCRKRILAVVCLQTTVIAILLFLLENTLLELGPQRAAFPFCVVFTINQVISTIAILIELNLLFAPGGKLRTQISIQTLLVATFGFALFFGVARILLRRDHDWFMALALGLTGITVPGLCLVVHAAIAQWRAERRGLYSTIRHRAVFHRD